MIVSMNVSYFVQKICHVLTILHQPISRGVAILGHRVGQLLVEPKQVKLCEMLRDFTCGK